MLKMGPYLLERHTDVVTGEMTYIKVIGEREHE